MKLALTAFVLIFIIFVSGCISASPKAAGQTSVQPQNQSNENTIKSFRVVIGHTFYEPAMITVSKGDVVQLYALAAKGTGVESGLSHNHGVTIDEYSINVVAPSENTPTPVTFVADKAGTFSIYCRTCWDGPFGRGHPDIRATLVVK